MSQDEFSPELRDTLEERRQGKTTPESDLELSPAEGFVGDDVTMRGTNLPADTRVDIVWHTATGRWGVLKANDIVGPQFQPRTEHVTTVETSSDGDLAVNWTIPQDYGGDHIIEIRSHDGDSLAKANYSVRPWFEIDRTTVPMGEMIQVVGYGLGPNVLTNNYQLAWDNGVVGFMTGVMNNGTATGQLRAVGPVGKHQVQVWRNFRGIPFLQNNTQSPFGPVAGGRDSVWTIEVTEPESEPEVAWMDQLMDEAPLSEHYPELDEDTEATLEITPTSGQSGTSAVLTGRDFPPETEVDLIWYTHEGHRIKGVPITAEPRPNLLPVVTTDEDGTFEYEFEIPNEQGATRPITAEVDGRSVAVTGFVLQPKILTLEPTEVAFGEEIEVEFTGVGWPKYENAYFFVYDNKPLGYVCSIDNEDGIVRTKIRATGEPGTHFIDVYPGIFDMEEDEPDFELMPHLSYIDNHPVRPLPAMHFAIELTE